MLYVFYAIAGLAGGILPGRSGGQLPGVPVQPGQRERHQLYRDRQQSVYGGQILDALPKKERTLTAAEERKAKTRGILALVLGFIIGVECGFMGSAGGVLMLMVLTLMLGMETKLAVGTASLVMMLVALAGAVSHVAMGADLELMPSIVMTAACTAGAVVSSRFANKVEEKTLNRAAGVVLLLVSAVSLVLSR